MRKQFSHGLQLAAAYSWSRSFATTSWRAQSLRRAQRFAVSAPQGRFTASIPCIDRNRFIVNYHYELPFGHPQGIAGKLVEGWTVSGVTTIQDGNPLNITDSRGRGSLRDCWRS